MHHETIVLGSSASFSSIAADHRMGFFVSRQQRGPDPRTWSDRVACHSNGQQMFAIERKLLVSHGFRGGVLLLCAIGELISG
jgi:hypothetical protein